MNILGNYAVKGASLVISLIVLPSYISYFTSQAVLGVWFTLIAVLNWVLLFDFGIGGGVRNQIVEPLEKKDGTSISEILSTSYLLIGVIVIVIVAAAWPICQLVDWKIVFGTDPQSVNDSTLKLTIYILFIGLAVRFFSVLVSHILYAMQKAVLPSAIILMSNVLILAYLLIANHLSFQGDLVSLALVTAFAYNAPALLVTFTVFHKYFKGIGVHVSHFRVKRIRGLLGTGGKLLYMQILVAFIFGIKELLISWFTGSSQVVDYQVYFKLIGSVGTVFALAMTPIWSEVTKSLVLQNYTRIISLYKTACKVVVLFGIGQLVLIPAMPWIVKSWLGDGVIETSYWDATIFCIFNVSYMWIMLNYNFACGLTLIRSFAVHLSIAAVLNIALAALLCSVDPCWTMVIVATILALLPCSILAPKKVLKYLHSVKESASHQSLLTREGADTGDALHVH